MNWFPVGTKTRSSACGTATDTSRSETGGGECRRMRCSAPARLCRQMLHFASLTEILSLRYRLSVFLSRRKKNSEKERPLRGFRREVRFIMSPPGKRRHNELNAAPPPENPRVTGKPGAITHRDIVHSGKRFCVRGKSRLFGEPRGTIPT